MPAIIFHEPVFATLVESGDKLFCFITNTTTDLTIYTDSSLSTAATQPVVANSAGRFPVLYIDSTSSTPSFLLTDTNDVEKYTVDPYPIEDTSALSGQVAINSTNITAIDGRLITAESDITDLETTESGFETRIAALEGGGGAPSISIFTGSGTYTKPAGLKAIKVTVVGAGGGGVNYSQSTAGGAGGGAAVSLLAAAAIAATETVTVGTGGVGVTGLSGNDGGASSFGSLLSATGGKGGLQLASEPVEGGVGSNGNIFNASGEPPMLSSAVAFGHTNFPGGGSLLGGSKVNGVPDSPGAGGAVNLAAAGDDGADGIVIIEQFF